MPRAAGGNWNKREILSCKIRPVSEIANAAVAAEPGMPDRGVRHHGLF